MINNRLMALCVLVFVLMLAPAAVRSAEELFDTKAATQHIEKGITLLQAKNYDAAIKEFEESSAIYPDAEAFYYLGYAYYMKGKITDNGESRKKSMENFDRAYGLNPNFTPTRFKPEEADAVKSKPKEEKKSEQPPQPQPVIPETPEDQAPETPAQQ